MSSAAGQAVATLMDAPCLISAVKQNRLQSEEYKSQHVKAPVSLPEFGHTY